MGTNQLIKLLTPTFTLIELSALSGKWVGIDASVWLHQFCYRHAKSVVRGNYTPVIEALSKRACDLTALGIILYFVFENRKVVAKAKTDKQRAVKRAKAWADIQGHDSEGEIEVSQKVLQALVSVTPELVTQAIAAVRRLGIHYVVAPGEADSQLVYFSRVAKNNGQPFIY